MNNYYMIILFTVHLYLQLSIMILIILTLNLILIQAFKPMTSNIVWRILVLAVLLLSTQSLYSPYYKRCRINKTAINDDAVPIEELQIQLIPNYYEKYHPTPLVKTELQIQYKNYDYYFHEFIDAGGSGEVYLVEDAKTGEGKVAKRYFKEKPHDFNRQNYIMSVLNYPIEWNKYCKGYEKCPQEQTQFNTVAIYPYKETIVLRSLQFDGKEAPLIFYKLLKEMDKCHKAGIVHNDIKMGNVLINSMGLNFKFYELQLIDWNLAKFYYKGMDDISKRGTVCYYSPEELLKTIHVTPARDIWSLGVAMYTYYTNQKPFTYNCKKDNLKAIVGLVGAQKILQLYKKYRMSNFEAISLLNQLEADIHKYPEVDLYSRPVKQNKEFYTKDLVDVFKRMLEPDPEKRATTEQLMKMKYFRHIKALPEMFYYRDQRKKLTKQPKNSVEEVIGF